MRETIIMDCDPGQDDAVSLLLALAAPKRLDVLGITTVAGNVPLALTQRNARLICDLAGRDDVPVFAGCEKPLLREPLTAESVHGSTGIDGMPVTEPKRPLQSQHAVDFLIATLKAAASGSITLVPTGPLTNLGQALQQSPEIRTAIKRIVLMGGAMREGGNFSPSAEFNILVDPHAAKIVFESGCPLVVMGLDVTHQVLATPERIAHIKAIDSPVGDATAGMLSYFNRHDTAKYGSAGAPLHDPCTIAWLLRPELFGGKHCNIAIEVESELTMGHTAVDFWNVTDRPANAEWIYAVDADGFFALLTEQLARY